MKLLKCLCSSATCAQTAQLTSQHVRQARTTREMRATALASAGGSAAVALPFGCCGRATNGGAGEHMSFSAGWCLQAPLLWPCRSMRQDARAHEAPQHPIALSQQLHTHVVLRARRLLTALRRYVADGARAWTCATAWPPWNSRAWLCAAQQSAYGALAGRAKNAPHELPIEEVWWILWTDALWLAQQLAPVGTSYR